MNAYEIVTKIDAAERELSVAIRLFFERRDLIAVHALAAAAHDVLRKLAHASQNKGIYEHADKQARPDKRKEALLQSEWVIFEHFRWLEHVSENVQAEKFLVVQIVRAALDSLDLGVQALHELECHLAR